MLQFPTLRKTFAKEIMYRVSVAGTIGASHAQELVSALSCACAHTYTHARTHTRACALSLTHTHTLSQVLLLERSGNNPLTTS